MKKEILSWVKTIILAVLLAFVVDTVFIVNATVPTGSMENTIMAGDRILALRTSYWFSDPERGDVVVFEDPDDPTGKTLYVKRIIGVGGDTVEVQDGEVLVNGQVQDEPYIKEITEGDFGPYHVPEGCYFMMGDNRNKSGRKVLGKHLRGKRRHLGQSCPAVLQRIQNHRLNKTRTVPIKGHVRFCLLKKLEYDTLEAENI